MLWNRTHKKTGEFEIQFFNVRQTQELQREQRRILVSIVVLSLLSVFFIISGLILERSSPALADIRMSDSQSQEVSL